jgi:two-component system, NarL family, invasion response regulator UvrY
MIKILIVDDHLLIREGFKKIIGQEVDMKVVAECKNAAEVMDFLRDGECDVIVLDINMPGKSGLDLLKELPLRETGTKVLVLSMNPEERFALRALQAGASGYITKETAAEELVEAIRKVHYGGKYITRSLAEQLAAYVQRDADGPLHAGLSDREFQVLQLLGAGKTTTEIGEQLALSVNTVKTYRQRILDKLNLDSTAEIIHYAVKNGLVD